MGFLKSKFFKYIKNLIIGAAAAVVMIGALFKIMSWEGADIMLIAGLCTEAGLFLLLGLLGPEKDYYWEKLYPGLDKYNSQISPLANGGGVLPVVNNLDANTPMNSKVVEDNLSGMLQELQSMSKSLGSLKALQEVDFSETGDQLKSMNNFYSRMKDAMVTMNDSVEDVNKYKENLSTLNRNLSSLNSVYGNVLTAFGNNK